MAMDNLAHNVEEYYIGKGIMTIKPEGETTWFDLGNVPEFEITPNVEQLEHYSSRTGVRYRDLTVIQTKSLELRVVMEEWVSFNMGLVLMGDVTEETGPPETQTIQIMSLNKFTCGVRFQGQNEVGARWNFEFPRVDFMPSSSMNPISEEWGTMEITGQAAAQDIGSGVMSFGTAVRNTDGTTVAWAP